MATTERHTEISARFLEHAEAELQAGDLLQASEKAWGAVAHYLNSLARRYGWRMSSHNDLRENARRVMRLTRNPEFSEIRYSFVESLHGNFYHDFTDARGVAVGLQSAKALLADMEAVDLDEHFEAMDGG